jgi:uncharacterized protein (DUF1810 family)
MDEASFIFHCGEVIVSELARFIKAQESTHSGFEVALAEMKAGHKDRHWIWYIFPQISGLGSSPQSRAYAIQSVAEASDYLRDKTLGPRLLAITEVVAQQVKNNVPIETLMGWDVDAQKLVSSLTLFVATAKKLFISEKLPEYQRLAQLSDEILDIAEAQGFPRCRHTMAQLK